MGKYLTQMETHFIHDSVNLSQAKAILDLGSEAGRFSQVPTHKEVTAVSLDIDSYGLKRLHLKTKRVNVVQADARKIPLKDETFDIIFMIETLDYIPELNEALAEIHRTLKPEASLFLSFGKKSSLKSKLRELRGKSYTHSYRNVIHSLLKTGFTVKRKMGYSWLPFGRKSQNRLVPLLASGERIFALRRIPSLSPWIIVHAVKLCSGVNGEEKKQK